MRKRAFLFLLICLGCERSASTTNKETASSTATGVTQINVAPNDSFISEYQIVAPDSSVGSWYLYASDIPGADIFFVGTHARHPAGSMVIWLDTAVRATEDHGVRWTHADSVVVQGLRHLEYLGRFCVESEGPPVNRVVGLITEGDTTARPRLAWRFNAQTYRIDSYPVDSIRCLLNEPVDDID